MSIDTLMDNNPFIIKLSCIENCLKFIWNSLSNWSVLIEHHSQHDRVFGHHSTTELIIKRLIKIRTVWLIKFIRVPQWS